MNTEKIYNETELVGLLQKRDQQAFLYLYDNYAPALNGVIIKLVENNEIAEDILQEAFLKIWNNFESYDASKGRLFTWMMNLTRNHTIDTLRSKGYKQQKKILSDEYFVSNRADNEHEIEKFDFIGIRQQMANLKSEHRLIIELAYFNGYTQDEISKETGVPLGTIKTRMRAAILALRKIVA